MAGMKKHSPKKNHLTSLLDAARITEIIPTLSGRRLARVQQLTQEGTGYTTQLHEITDTDTYQLTHHDESVGAVAIDDHDTIFFLSSREDTVKDPEAPSEGAGSSLWQMRSHGEARRIATRPWGYTELKVVGKTLYVTMQVHTQARSETDHRERVEARTKAKVSGVLYDSYPTRAWDHDLPAGRTVIGVAPIDKLNQYSSEFSWVELPEGQVTSWDIDPKGRFALVSVTQAIGFTPGTAEVTGVHKVDLGTGAMTELVPGTTEASYDVGQISPDGTRAIINKMTVWDADSSMKFHPLCMEIVSAQLAPVWPELDQWTSPQWLTDQHLVATSDYLGAGAIWIGSVKDPQPTRLTPALDTLTAENNDADWSQARNYTGLATVPERNTEHQAELFALADGVATAPYPLEFQLDLSQQVPETTGTALPNPAAEIDPPGRLENVVVNVEDGTTVRGWLRLPEGEGPHPLVVFVHGGPWGSWNGWTYRWNPNPFVDAGYAVLLPDPAISTGYGQAMVDRGQHQLGGTPYTDVMALTDAVVARDDIDAARTALTGGSYGGYMANWVAGHTGDRFKCIVTHASLWNTLTHGRSTDGPFWDHAMADQHEQYSPHQFAANIRTPMLVIHGDKDYRVPISEGLQLWHALHTIAPPLVDDEGKTKHRFLYFADENHWILSRGNAQVWYETFLNFLNQHVLGEQEVVSSTLG